MLRSATLSDHHQCLSRPSDVEKPARIISILIKNLAKFSALTAKSTVIKASRFDGACFQASYLLNDGGDGAGISENGPKVFELREVDDRGERRLPDGRLLGPAQVDQPVETGSFATL